MNNLRTHTQTGYVSHVPMEERNQDATVYIGNIDEKVSDSILWEFGLQAGPVRSIFIPKDRVTGYNQGYGFIEYLTHEDAEYAIKILNMVKLYGKPVKVNKSTVQPKNLDVGANIFIGNLDPEVDEKMVYDTFSAFGVILQSPRIMKEVDTGVSRGYAFVNYASFEASDAAIAAMNGQHLCNRVISVSYAFKKDSKTEKHGSSAERILAASNPYRDTQKPHSMFGDSALPSEPVVSAPPPVAPPVAPPMIGNFNMTMLPPPMIQGMMGGFMPPPPPFGGFAPPPFPMNFMNQQQQNQQQNQQRKN